MKILSHLFTILFSFCSGTYIIAQAGANDTTFNTVDKGIGSLGANNPVETISTQTDGKIIIGGSFTDYNGISCNRVTRIYPDGSLDSTFNTGTGANGKVRASAIQADDKILLAGEFIGFNNSLNNRIVRLNIDGSTDSTFTASASNTINTILIQPDGKIIITGSFSTVNTVNQNKIARLNADGSLDTTFNTGTGPNRDILTTDIQPNGKVIIAGSFSTFDGRIANDIIRIHANGTIDTTFYSGAGTGTLWDHRINNIHVLQNGKIIITGNFTSFNFMVANRVARLHANGSLDATFSVGTGADHEIYTSAIQPDGKIIVAGYFNYFNGIRRTRSARLNPDGAIDTTYSDPGFIIEHNPTSGYSVRASSIQSDGKIIFGGYFTSDYHNHITCMKPEGIVDGEFNKTMGFNGTTRTSYILQSDKILIGGTFTFFNGRYVRGIARILSDGQLDTTFNALGAGANHGVYAIDVQSDGKIIIAGDFTNFNGVPCRRIARLNTDGSLDTTFNVIIGANNTIVDLKVQPDDKIVIAGGFWISGSSSLNRVARLNADGSLDTTFAPGTGANNWVTGLVLQPDGKIIVLGMFTAFNNVPYGRIVRLDTDGTLDNSFNVGGGGGNWQIYSGNLQSDGKIIIFGGFTSYNGVASNRMARLNIDGSLDTTFRSLAGANDWITSSSIQTNGRIIIAGDFTRIYDDNNSIIRNRVARFNKDGSIDNTFSPVGANRWINLTNIQSDGKIIIGGEFTHYNFYGRNRIARIVPCISNVTTDVINACNSYTWIDGNTYVSSNNTATVTLNNSAGCDSVVTLDLIISDSATNANTGTDVISTCNSYTWIDGTTYTSSNNTATVTLTNAAGCDSVVTLDLTIEQTTIGTHVVTACDSYIWIDGTTYTSSNNTATVTLTNAAGCDSVVSLDLTIMPQSVGTAIKTACGSYTWIDGITYISSNNTATVTLTNATGCDSVVTLDLTINIVDTTITRSNSYTLVANSVGAMYQWLDCDRNFATILGEDNPSFIASVNGKYAVEVSEDGCTDTSDCFEITSLSIANQLYDQLYIYPSPNQGSFTIDLGTAKTNVLISITDLIGKTIFHKLYQQEKILDLSLNVPSGMYVISIEWENEKVVEELIINH